MAQSDYLLIVKTMKRMDAIEAKFADLEKRLTALEAKPKLGRPPKDDTKAA